MVEPEPPTPWERRRRIRAPYEYGSIVSVHNGTERSVCVWEGYTWGNPPLVVWIDRDARTQASAAPYAGNLPIPPGAIQKIHLPHPEDAKTVNLIVVPWTPDEESDARARHKNKPEVIRKWLTQKYDSPEKHSYLITIPDRSEPY